MLAASAAFAALGACSPSDPAPRPHPNGSFLAVGDTGEPWGALPFLFEPQLAVGHALARVHEAFPTDAFVLLGDNFYPDGLTEEEVLPRVVENVALPYCAFVRPSPELQSALGGACEPPPDPPPLYAVIGNHDVRAAESPDLQRTRVPQLLTNWEVPTTDAPAVRELPGGLSLIFVVSESPWGDAETAALADALRRARGPFRVIVGHRPPITGHPQLSGMVRNAARDAGIPVHAYVAGHVHVLGAIPSAVPGAAPSLTVIAGSGAHAELQTSTEYRIEAPDFLEASIGFVRFDSFLGEPEPKLRVTLYRVAPLPLIARLRAPEIAARYAIGLAGEVSNEPTTAD
ncbi:MAG: metallophosphoesterase [bacterium]|nr:metallophosphoesterase [bacterium]